MVQLTKRLGCQCTSSKQLTLLPPPPPYEVLADIEPLQKLLKDRMAEQYNYSKTVQTAKAQAKEDGQGQQKNNSSVVMDLQPELQSKIWTGSTARSLPQHYVRQPPHGTTCRAECMFLQSTFFATRSGSMSRKHEVFSHPFFLISLRKSSKSIQPSISNSTANEFKACFLVITKPQRFSDKRHAIFTEISLEKCQLIFGFLYNYQVGEGNSYVSRQI